MRKASIPAGKERQPALILRPNSRKQVTLDARVSFLEGGSNVAILVEYLSLVDAHDPVQAYDEE